ncbi:hypothetical protein OG2516_12181 [Oceanicola granulosus HTCC2516]|uniref:L-rhamnose mutarotase n=1 Tax=Oceanicola granulosus (strain ATCC BAA-861 / DSM 15982 / KCTC 12143 / HTCC2516) TaxID=314256 RepID=Q2CD72_OCEGH|nr:L-rhamnose mutarotase [Oceanicola granulosus]EAR50606.1 hypothetical protein OG2516_12181 [Oceanicola granulosus HTCC2516]
MQKYAFRMNLHPGKAEEYKSRHDEIWPELVELLKSAGVSDYSIHLDEETDHLFAVLWRTNDHAMGELGEHQVMQKWWQHMADLMETDASGAPVVVDLQPMFHMP